MCLEIAWSFAISDRCHMDLTCISDWGKQSLAHLSDSDRHHIVMTAPSNLICMSDPCDTYLILQRTRSNGTILLVSDWHQLGAENSTFWYHTCDFTKVKSDIKNSGILSALIWYLEESDLVSFRCQTCAGIELVWRLISKISAQGIWRSRLIKV